MSESWARNRALERGYSRRGAESRGVGMRVRRLNYTVGKVYGMVNGTVGPHAQVDKVCEETEGVAHTGLCGDKGC